MSAGAASARVAVDPLPTLFISHGSPMHALDGGAAGAAWTRLAARLPRPRALLMVSAHWETERPALTESTKPDTIHDFYGFPEPLYRIHYAAPGAPDVAARARRVRADPDRPRAHADSPNQHPGDEYFGEPGA